MKAKQKLKKIAKTMLTKSLTAGALDETKVKKVLKIAAASHSPQISKILKVYKGLAQRALAKDQLTIESASPLGPREINVLLTKTQAKKIHHKTNPEMVFGVKITHGDWVYDASLDSKLKQLKGTT